MNYNRLNHIIVKLLSAGYTFDSVFDIGANQGSWSHSWKNSTLPGTSFTMFEANPSHQAPSWMGRHDRWINTVLTKPGVNNVAFYHIPNSPYGGTGDSYYKEVSSHYDNASILNLAATTLDDIVYHEGLPPPQLIKLDTQGSEVDILLGAKKTFENVGVCLCELPISTYNHGAPTFEAYISAFAGLRFKPVGIDQDHFANGVMVQMDLVFVKENLLTAIR